MGTTKYHGTPLSPIHHLYTLQDHHFVVPFIRPESIKHLLVHGIAKSVMLDSGAYSAWRRGFTIDWNRYYSWADQWFSYDNTWAVIGDVIDGTEEDNNRLIAEWPHGHRGAPVWHMHESLDKLRFLSSEWPRVCVGSSGSFATVGTKAWAARMDEAMDAIVLPDGTMPTKLHMLRGLKLVKSPWRYPFSSVDSATVARNFKTVGRSPLELVTEWDQHNCPSTWTHNST